MDATMDVAVRLEPDRAVALEDGEPVATFTYWQDRWHLHPGEFFCEFSFAERLAPEVHGGVAQQLYDAALPQMLAGGVLLLRTGTGEDDPFLPELRRLGFRTYRHVFTPVLDVRTFDVNTLEPFAGGSSKRPLFRRIGLAFWRGTRLYLSVCTP